MTEGRMAKIMRAGDGVDLAAIRQNGSGRVIRKAFRKLAHQAQHDILTGSRPDGTAFAPGEDRTCGNWTKGGDGAAFVGHHDRMGLDTSPPALSWNSSHPSRGCSVPQLNQSGGAGFLYCFAAK